MTRSVNAPEIDVAALREFIEIFDSQGNVQFRTWPVAPRLTTAQTAMTYVQDVSGWNDDVVNHLATLGGEGAAINVAATGDGKTNLQATCEGQQFAVVRVSPEAADFVWNDWLAPSFIVESYEESIQIGFPVRGASLNQIYALEYWLTVFNYQSPYGYDNRDHAVRPPGTIDWSLDSPRVSRLLRSQTVPAHDFEAFTDRMTGLDDERELREAIARASPLGSESHSFHLRRAMTGFARAEAHRTKNPQALHEYLTDINIELYGFAFSAAEIDGFVVDALGTSSTENSVATEPRNGFRLVPATDLLRHVSPPDWLVEGLIERNSTAMLFGQSGAGKSFVAIDIACAVATGSAWHGRATKRGGVAYIAGEGQLGYARRLHGWQANRGHSLDDGLLCLSTGPTSALDATQADLLIERLREFETNKGRIELVVLDTVARNLGPGDENSNADASRFMQLVDRVRDAFGCAVLLVHHTGHQATDRARGATAFRAAVDHELRLKKSDDVIVLEVTKNKEGELPPPLRFELKQVIVNANGCEFTTAVLQPSTKVRPIEKRLPTGKARIAYKVLVGLIHDAPKATTDTISEAAQSGAMRVHTPAISIADWRAGCTAEGLSNGSAEAERKAFDRAKEKLIQIGLISVCGDMVSIVTPGADS